MLDRIQCLFLWPPYKRLKNGNVNPEQESPLCRVVNATASSLVFAGVCIVVTYIGTKLVDVLMPPDFNNYDNTVNDNIKIAIQYVGGVASVSIAYLASAANFKIWPFRTNTPNRNTV